MNECTFIYFQFNSEDNENFLCEEENPGFYPYENCSTGCMKPSAMDETFHEFLTLVSKEMGATSSLFDIVTMYNPGIPKTLYNQDEYVPGDLPFHTLCKYEPKLPLFFMNHFWGYTGIKGNCTQLWEKYITSSDAGSNPYLIPENDYLSKCSKGIEKLAK